MKTTFQKTEITGITATVLLCLSLIAAAPALADHLPNGAKCVNDVVTAKHKGAPGKNRYLFKHQVSCGNATETATHQLAVNPVQTQKSYKSGVPGKSVYFRRFQRG